MFHEEAEEGGDEEAGEEEAGQSSVQQGASAERADIQERLVSYFILITSLKYLSYKFKLILIES